MLAPMHDDRPLEIGGGAETVGAANIFRPYGSRTDAGCIRSITETGIGYDIEQQAVGICKSDHEIGAGNLLMQGVHFSERKAAHKRTTLLLLAQNNRADEFGLR